MSYDLIRGLHLVAMVAWMAGLLILPRLFVYQMQAAGTPMVAVLDHAERRLLRLIMNPAMIVTWGLGLTLIHLRGGEVLAEPWMAVKLAGAVLVTAWHMYLAGARKRFAAGRNTRSERFWRISNELPFVAAIVMILAVTTEFG
jgi:putative membrane protein